MKGQGMFAFSFPCPSRSLAGEGNLLTAKARLVAQHRSGAALASQAVTHGDARWLAVNREVKLPATAGGASGSHESAPWLSSSMFSNREIHLLVGTPAHFE
jgi:hypothetical protein